tara:strand:- start:3644 stop:4633 length:990 start_codon:yes stop_codon:yes gene_type:complete
MRKEKTRQQNPVESGHQTSSVFNARANKAVSTTKRTELVTSVLKRIEGEHVVPSSKWRFVCTEYGIWALWALTVVIGALSVAVMIFVGGHARFALYEATHDTALSFFVEVLPYIWIVVFVVMTVLAYVNLRHTKRGYRYQVYHVVISSVVFSVVGGLVLHVFGIGSLIDTQFGKRMPNYQSMEKAEIRMWQAPKEGRLVGIFSAMDETDTLYVFTDEAGQVWKIETLELRDRDKELLSSGYQVRVLGTTTDAAQYRFYACGVFPWMFGKDVSTMDIREDRKQFVARMYEHMETRKRLLDIQRETYGNDIPMPFVEGKCGELAVMERMKF